MRCQTTRAGPTRRRCCCWRVGAVAPTQAAAAGVLGLMELQRAACCPTPRRSPGTIMHHVAFVPPLQVLPPVLPLARHRKVRRVMAAGGGARGRALRHAVRGALPAAAHRGGAGGGCNARARLARPGEGRQRLADAGAADGLAGWQLGGQPVHTCGGLALVAECMQHAACTPVN